MNEKLNKNDFLGLKSFYKGLSQPLTTKEVCTFANQTRRLFVIDSNEAIEESMDKLQKEENICKSIEKKTSKTLVKHNETNK
jgi:TPP-dependent indolepyruvate ferredoxin oxidoreductase alpha subunit